MTSQVACPSILLFALCISSLASGSESFSHSHQRQSQQKYFVLSPCISQQRARSPQTPSVSLRMGIDIIDAEIVSESKDENNDGEDGNGTNGGSTTSLSDKLIEMTLNAAPEWKEIVVDFVERMPSKNLKIIACRMPFIVEVDGVAYSIGVPIDDAVAVLEDGEGTPRIVDPDEDSNEEVFQLAASALAANMGEDLRLCKTPRVLTVHGDIKKLTGNYLGQIDNTPVEVEDLANDQDEDDAFFEIFFKEQLGDRYNEEFGLNVGDEQAENLMELFSCPGLGTEEDNKDAIKDMFSDIYNAESSTHSLKDGTSDPDLTMLADSDGTKAFPLFPFTSPDGKSYAFVQLAESPLLVGKADPTIAETQRLLLSEDEAADILPRIEEQFRIEFERAGILSSDDSGDSNAKE